MVDERRKRIPQALLWALAGAALAGVFVFVVAVAPSLFIRHPYSGLKAVDELKARNDVRTTLVQALAGLAVAGGLIVTYRTYRLNRAEQDRTYERELYAKAVEQLGHEKAPVRLGALYSLERLAQDKPQRRQIIVDVICAYLRMPFSQSPTEPASKPEPAAVGEQRDRDAEAETKTDDIGDTWRQERQVRLTAQHILSKHLRDDRTKEQRSTRPPSPDLWPGISLDLIGATLIDFNLKNGAVADADFSRATFSGGASFAEATFSGVAWFGGATFNGGAWFDGATFSGGAGFDEATFNGGAWFDEATFNGGALFRRAIFSGGAGFDEATFSGGARFRMWTFPSRGGYAEATFSGGAWFRRATFSGVAWFDGATFSGRAEFGGATFNDGALFGGATFNDGGATFSGGAEFDGATFSGVALFGGATFSRGEDSLSFDQSTVRSPDAEDVWPTGWGLGPDGRGGYTVVRVGTEGNLTGYYRGGVGPVTSRFAPGRHGHAARSALPAERRCPPPSVGRSRCLASSPPEPAHLQAMWRWRGPRRRTSHR